MCVAILPSKRIKCKIKFKIPVIIYFIPILHSLFFNERFFLYIDFTIFKNMLRKNVKLDQLRRYFLV